VTRHRFSFAAWLLAGFMLAGPANVFAMPSPSKPRTCRALCERPPLRHNFTGTASPRAPNPAAPAADPATDAQAAGEEPIGNVATLTGIATVIRKKDSIALKLQDDIFQNDVLQTSANSTLGVTFNDATTFNLTANARITVDNYVYEDGGKQNAALFDVVKGTVAFVAAAVAKTGDMKSRHRPRRWHSRHLRPGRGAGRCVGHKPEQRRDQLYPDADGKVGRIEVHDRAGVRLGFLTQGASGFTIRPGGGARFAAVPLTISPQQALRDRGFVRQVHSTQNLGRQVVTQQRALRRANPALNNPNRANQPRQSGPQRQNDLPQRPGSQQPDRQTGRDSHHRTFRTGRAAAAAGFALATRAAAASGQPQQPGGQAQPGPQNAPGVRQPPNLQQQPNAPACSGPDCRTGPSCNSGDRPCQRRRENRGRKGAKAKGKKVKGKKALTGWR